MQGLSLVIQCIAIKAQIVSGEDNAVDIIDRGGVNSNRAQAMRRQLGPPGGGCHNIFLVGEFRDLTPD